MKQNNSTELLGHSFYNICNKNDPPPQTPTDPKSDCFRIFLDFLEKTFFSDGSKGGRAQPGDGPAWPWAMNLEPWGMNHQIIDFLKKIRGKCGFRL